MRWNARRAMREDAQRALANIRASHVGANGYGTVALTGEQLAAYERACWRLGRWEVVWVR